MKLDVRRGVGTQAVRVARGLAHGGGSGGGGGGQKFYPQGHVSDQLGGGQDPRRGEEGGLFPFLAGNVRHVGDPHLLR